MKVDYLIAGGGLCGSLLGYELMQRDRSVVVIDDGSTGAASRVAGGIINPVTGMRLVKTWLIEELLPTALNKYRELEQWIDKPLVTECSLLDFYATADEKQVFEQKAGEGNAYLRPNDNSEKWSEYFSFNYGIGEIKPCLLVDLRTLVAGIGNRLREAGCLREDRIDWLEFVVKADGVIYKDIEATKLICCEGADGAENPWFGGLPWSKDKGEVIIASIPGLPKGHIYKQQFGMVPWQNDQWWIGATHDWKYTDMEPTADFRSRVEEHLNYWLKLPYAITDHLVARRPANLDRKPFVGFHPVHSSVGILNGMGGKGVSMAPYFVAMLAMHLVSGEEIMKEVDVCRFKRILSR